MESSSENLSKNKLNETQNGKTSHLRQEKGIRTTKGFTRHFTKHDYHDYSRVRPNPPFVLSNTKATRGGVYNPFPSVLHGMMEEAMDKGFSDVISWQVHGRAFLIRDPKTFSTTVLPMYFKHSKLSSFQRQLSLYGFVRLTRDGPDIGAYYHEYFLRGRPFLCSRIQRTRVKGTWIRTSASPESEPDFSSMERVLPLNEIGALSDDSRIAETATCSSSRESENEIFIGYSSLVNGLLLPQDERQRLNSMKAENHSTFTTNVDLRSGPFLPKPTQDALGTTFPIEPSQWKEHDTQMVPVLPENELDAPPLTFFLPKRSPAFEIPRSLFGSSSSMMELASPLDSNELASFLPDVDLDTNFDAEDVLRVSMV